MSRGRPASFKKFRKTKAGYPYGPWLVYNPNEKKVIELGDDEESAEAKVREMQGVTVSNIPATIVSPIPAVEQISEPSSSQDPTTILAGWREQSSIPGISASPSIDSRPNPPIATTAPTSQPEKPKAIVVSQ